MPQNKTTPFLLGGSPLAAGSAALPGGEETSGSVSMARRAVDSGGRRPTLTLDFLYPDQLDYILDQVSRQNAEFVDGIFVNHWNTV